jgi:c-di-GMP-binding flagellar brake protein YcgR
MSTALHVNRRAFERFSLPPMYTAITASRAAGACLSGHAYDISEGGMRLELDEALAPGEVVTVDIELPGTQSSISVRGNVVWVNDADDDPGPRRHAMRFADFATPADHARLVSFLGQRKLRRAA